MADTWRSRRIKSGQIRAGDLIPHPKNPKLHPDEQRKAVSGSLSELGQIAPIIINITNGYLVDGHERAWLALGEGEDTLVDCDWVELTEEEHEKALVILDATGTLFDYEPDILESLLATIETKSEGLQAMLDVLALDNEGKPKKHKKLVICPHCGKEF